MAERKREKKKATLSLNRRFAVNLNPSAFPVAGETASWLSFVPVSREIEPSRHDDDGKSTTTLFFAVARDE